MKYLIFISIFFSTSIYASKLKGRWSICHSDDPKWHIEHVIEFDEKSKLEMFITHEANKEKPCEGEMINYFARHWDIIVVDNNIESTLFMTNAKILHKKGLSFFNEENMCNKNQWKVSEWIDCTNTKMGGLEIPSKSKATHKFLLMENILQLTDKDGTKSDYSRMNY